MVDHSRSRTIGSGFFHFCPFNPSFLIFEARVVGLRPRSAAALSLWLQIQSDPGMEVAENLVR